MTFNFRGNEEYYYSHWKDNTLFTMDFGDGKFIDEDGDSYFIHCEYCKEDNSFIFEVWFEYDTINIEDMVQTGADKYITAEEMKTIKNIMIADMK